MFSRDRYPAYLTLINGVIAPFRFALNSSSAPTITYGSSWISSVTHSSATNTYTVTMKDNIVAILDCAPDLRDNSQSGVWSSFGSVSNEGTSLPCSFVLATFTASGANLSDFSGVIGGTVIICNTGLGTPGGN